MNNGNYRRWRRAPKQNSKFKLCLVFIGRLLLEFPNSGAIFMRSSKQGTNNEALGCRGCIVTHDVGRWGSGKKHRIGACRTCRWIVWDLTYSGSGPYMHRHCTESTMDLLHGNELKPGPRSSMRKPLLHNIEMCGLVQPLVARCRAAIEDLELSWYWKACRARRAPVAYPL